MLIAAVDLILTDRWAAFIKLSPNCGSALE
ncbi:hypothetical protein J2W83_002569 [Pseudomonas hunanensis]|uniref:Uncharacterized protein n=1 Tax=Pseudomonas hunanensis TaxID=1247546 RepID=A0ACC6K3K5_9PSED|nr:hypothetical protein [Pseudomonas hunanensis]